MNVPARRKVFFTSLALAITAIVLGAPRIFGSCVPLHMQASIKDPGVVVIAGVITNVTDRQIVFAVERWWGNTPQTNAAVERPATDPAVISSTDGTRGSVRADRHRTATE